MKKRFYIVLFFFLPFLCMGQNDSINTNLSKEESRFKNQIDLDVEFLAFSFGYKRRISEKWLVGPSIGFGLALHPVYANEGFNESNFSREIAHIGITFKYYLNNQIQFELDPQLMVSSPQGFEFDSGGEILGLGLGFYYGKTIQIGIKTMVGYFKVSNTTSSLYLSSSLLIIRIPIKW